tara:strand:+ start:169 stop:747 length:579 start_codon:yes stop_codon:yes gene_type:complete
VSDPLPEPEEAITSPDHEAPNEAQTPLAARDVPPEPAAESAAESAPQAGPSPPTSTWDPEPTFADRLSPHLRRAVKVTGAGVATLVLGSQLLWAIPAWIVSQRPGFEALRQGVEADRGYQQALWGPVEADAWPETYTLPEDPQGLERYTLIARGPGGEIRVEGHVKEGKVVHMQSRGVADWRSAWRARKASQ